MKLNVKKPQREWLNRQYRHLSNMAKQVKGPVAKKIAKLHKEMEGKTSGEGPFVVINRNEVRHIQSLCLIGITNLRNVTIPTYQKRGAEQYKEYIDKANKTLKMLEDLLAEAGKLL